ncbi:MAG: multi-sensor hybrid histidine kinase [Fibrobacteres bacterium]|nr:multi-sensor hybrid histidine kinase [Fibrobacterota bacterium]
MTMPENLSILLIESRGGIARALLSAQTGFTLTHADRMAKAGILASQARASGGFSLVLIDLTLPDSKGIESYRRASALLPGVPVVALYRGENPAFAETIISEGAQACLDMDGLDGGALAQALRQAVLRSRAEARRFRALFDSAPIGILLAAGRRVIMANPAALEILGRTESDLTRQSVLDFFPASSRPLLEKALDAGAGEIQETRFSAGLVRPGADFIRCRVFITGAVLNDAPAVALYLASMDEKETAADSADESPESGGLTHSEHVRQSRKMEALGRLAGGVAHDFNNLLTAINGYSEHLLTLPGAEGPIASGLKAIRRAGETAAAMTRSLMSFSRSEGAEARPVRVDAAIREMEPMLERLIGSGIEFLIKPGAADATVRMEPGQLEQLILNLCVNARDAMADGGVLTLATKVVEVEASDVFTHLASGQGTHVSISVEDTGIGMGPEILECLFEPFYTTKRGGRGTGLGLATVYGMVSQAGGGISVTSTPGEGSRFRIFLARDAALAGPESPDSPVQDAEWKPQPNRETVLVVEDEPSLREMIMTILGRYGFAVLEASSAAEAMDLVEERPDTVDLVVTDVMLRGEGGHELAESLQSIKPGLRTIFISGHSLESLADRDIIVPADAFLEKPFSPAQLAAKVRTVLDTARKS